MLVRFGRMNADIFSLWRALLPPPLALSDGDSGSANLTRIPKISEGDSGSHLISRDWSSSSACLTTALDGVGVSHLFIGDRAHLREIFGGDDCNLFPVFF
jgi:hypothetical protein